MRTQLMLCIVLLSALTNGCAKGGQPEEKSQAQLQVDTLIAKLANFDIGMVEILQIPPEVETPWAVSPDMLEKQFQYKLIIRNIRVGAGRDKLLEAMKSVSVVPQSRMPDIRWGLIFYDASEKRVGAVYLNQFGDSGVVGDIPVSFKGKLFKWLDGNFSCCFR